MGYMGFIGVFHIEDVGYNARVHIERVGLIGRYLLLGHFLCREQQMP
jgi:hypothetical protein